MNLSYLSTLRVNLFQSTKRWITCECCCTKLSIILSQPQRMTWNLIWNVWIKNSVYFLVILQAKFIVHAGFNKIKLLLCERKAFLKIIHVCVCLVTFLNILSALSTYYVKDRNGTPVTLSMLSWCQMLSNLIARHPPAA